MKSPVKPWLTSRTETSTMGAGDVKFLRIAFETSKTVTRRLWESILLHCQLSAVYFEHHDSEQGLMICSAGAMNT